MNTKTNKFQLIFSILMGVSMLCLYILPEGWFKYLLFGGLVIPYQIYELYQKRWGGKEVLFRFKRNENGQSFQIIGTLLLIYFIWIIFQIKADLERTNDMQNFPISNHFYQIFICLIFVQLMVSREWFYVTIYENHFTLHLPQRVDVEYAKITHFHKREYLFYVTEVDRQITIDLRQIKPEEVDKFEEMLTKQILAKRG